MGKGRPKKRGIKTQAVVVVPGMDQIEESSADGR
jgi:hypothetical protein